MRTVHESVGEAVDAVGDNYTFDECQYIAGPRLSAFPPLKSAASFRDYRVVSNFPVHILPPSLNNDG
jgi:hypothetical protein